jgi:hypothetical protein
MDRLSFVVDENINHEIENPSMSGPEIDEISQKNQSQTQELIISPLLFFHRRNPP